MSQFFAIFLTLWKEICGDGAECPFPFPVTSWDNAISNDSSQDMIARFAIHCALNPGACGHCEAFNVADNSKPATWSSRWPIICEYFGLKVTPPATSSEVPDLNQFFKDNQTWYNEMERKYGLVSERLGNERRRVDISQLLVSYLNFDRWLDMRKCHEAWNSGGKAEEIDT